MLFVPDRVNPDSPESAVTLYRLVCIQSCVIDDDLDLMTARLWYLQCVSNGDTTVLHLANVLTAGAPFTDMVEL